MGKLSVCREILLLPIRDHYCLFYRSNYSHRQLAYFVTDSGTTLAPVFDSVVSAFYDAIPCSQLDSSQRGYVYPANATVPDVEFAVGKNRSTLLISRLGRPVTACCLVVSRVGEVIILAFRHFWGC
jgi:hypothetical protein